jgi:amino acid permease
VTEEFLTREEILTGLPARRGSALLFLIESRTAHLAAHSRQAMERFLSEETARERDLAFLEAFALGRQPPLRPTIQDIERHAPEWAPLVPENPNVRAAAAHALGRKYAFTCRAVPGIRAALGLDTEAVQQAYRRLYREPLETIFAARPTPIVRLRWAVAALSRWLESLPPFWTAFALTFTETVGASILALPIALAGIGPLAGVVFLVVLGVVNLLTVVAMAEAAARSGVIRYGGFLGRMVADYLGRTGSVVLSCGLVVICFVALQIYYVGFATTLADATRVPAEVWTALLFLVALYFLRRETLTATVASALLVGAINVGLILLLVLFVLPHVRAENLLYLNVPLLNGRPFDPSFLQLLFGTILFSYFGHTSVGSCARVVLRRDPSARSLIGGVAAAQAAAITVYSVWVVVVNGAIAPQVLAGQTGTVLIPLAVEVGPGVRVAGSIYAILSVAMASIHISLALFHTVREWLPKRSQPVVLLPRRRGRLVFHARGRPGGGPRMSLTYLGLDLPEDSRPRFRLDVQTAGTARREEITVAGRWEDATLPGKGRLVLEVLDAGPESARVRVTSPLALTYEGEWDTTGLHVADLLALPDSWRQFLNWMIRRGEVTLAEVTARVGQGEADARAALAALVEDGLVRQIQTASETRYGPQFAPRRQRRSTQDVWKALGQETTGSLETRSVYRPSFFERLGKTGRFLLSASAVLLVFLWTEWLMFTNRESFSEPLSLLGTIVIALLGGIFPMLLLVSSRRKGDYVPDTFARWLGHPILVGGIYALYLASLFVHGLFIWQSVWQRAAVLTVGVLVLVMTVVLARRGAFARRAVVELRQDAAAGEQAAFAVVASGHPTIAEVRLDYADGERRQQAASGEIAAFSALRRAIFQLPMKGVRELKAWAHKAMPDGSSESLPVLLEVQRGDEVAQFDLQVSGGQVVLPVSGNPDQLQVTFDFR